MPRPLASPPRLRPGALLLAAGLSALLAGRAAAVDHLEEHGVPLDAAEVAAAGLEPLEAPRSLGFTGRPAWVRLRTVNEEPAPAERVLSWNWPLVDQLELHVPDGRGGFTHLVGGLGVGGEARQLSQTAQHHLRILRLGPGEALDVYVRVATRGAVLLDGGFSTPRTFVRAAARNVLWTGLWAGAVGVLLAAALWSWLASRERVYVDYALFCAAFGAYQLLMSGVASSLAPWSGDAALWLEPVAGGLASLTGVGMVRRSLDLGRRSPRFDGLLAAAAWLSLVAAAPIAWGDLPLANRATALTGGAAIAACLVLVARATARGDRTARDFLLGFGPFAVAGAWYVGMLQGLFAPAQAAQLAFQGTFLVTGLSVARSLSAQRRAEEDVNRRHLEAAVADRQRALDATVARLGAAQRLEAVGRLTAGVAHDFNNLLTAIGAGVSDLQEDAGGAARGPLFREIRELVRRGGELTRSLLLVARRQPIEPHPVALNALVGDTVRLLDRLVKGVELELDLDGETGTVLADPAQLEQVVLNLVLNARDACDGHGRITVSTRRVARADGEGGRPGGEWARLSVRDDGPGMDETTRARIFEPFFTTKGEGKGTGLGLSVVDGVARAHGGFVEVTTAPGAGATFAVWLPVAGAARHDAEMLLTPLPGSALTGGPGSAT